MSERKLANRGNDRRTSAPRPDPDSDPRMRPVSSNAVRVRTGTPLDKGTGRNATPSPDIQRNASYHSLCRPSSHAAQTPVLPSESADSNPLSSPFRKYSGVSPRVDSGLPRKRSRVNLLPEFSGLLTDDPLFASFVANPASTAEMLTREELLRRRCEATRNTYDALILRIIQHYYETEPDKHESEISLLKSLLGNIDKENLQALRILPGLPEDVRTALNQSSENVCSLPLESECLLTASISLLTVRRFDILRSVPHPSLFTQKIAAAYLSLFSKVDQSIEVTPGFHLVVSRAWETWQAYIKQPGHVVQTARNVVEFVKKGKIGSVEIKEMKSILNDLRPKGNDCTLVDETASLLYRFLTNVERFYYDWTRLHPLPKKNIVDLNKSSERLSRPKSTSQSQCKPASQPSTEPTDFSLILDSPTRHAGENKDVRIPSFGPGQFNMTETSIPSLDFEAVIVEPLEGEESTDVKGTEEATVRVKQETNRGEKKAMTSSEMTLEWELELHLRTLIQDKILRQGGDFCSLSVERLTGEAWSHSASLFSELRTVVLSADWTEKHVRVVGVSRFNELLSDFEEKLREPVFLKREIGKAVLRVKNEAERMEREKHCEKARTQKNSK